MSQDQTTISCPECGTEIDVNHILYHQVEGQLKKKYQDDLRKERESFLSKLEGVEKEKRNLALEKKRQADIVAEAVKNERQRLEVELTQKIKNQAAEEQKDALKTLQDELEEKSGQVKELNKTAAQLEALKREKSELEDKYKAEAERKINEQLSNERGRITTRRAREERTKI